MTEASEVFRVRTALGVVTCRLFLVLTPGLGAAVVEPPSVVTLSVEVVEAIEVARARGTAGTSSSDFALLKEDTSDTLELGRDVLGAKDERKAPLPPEVVVVGVVMLFRGSGFPLIVF
jgi:hypothetical protein